MVRATRLRQTPLTSRRNLKGRGHRQLNSTKRFDFWRKRKNPLVKNFTQNKLCRSYGNLTLADCYGALSGFVSVLIMRRLRSILALALGLGFTLIGFAADQGHSGAAAALVAESSGLSGASSHLEAVAGHESEALPLAAPILFDFGWFKITNSMVAMAAVASL